MDTKDNRTSTKVNKDNKFKQPQDYREYRTVELGNGMRSVLISDPEIFMASVCLDVGVGSSRDPQELPGLAHLLEHVWSGTVVQGADMWEFIVQREGERNAKTTLYSTCYYWSVGSQFLEETLQKMSQRLLDPYFSKTRVAAEIISIDQEFISFQTNECNRMEQIDKRMCNQSHDFSKFDVGNKKSLHDIPKSKGIDVYQQLIQFYKKWYSPNIMTLIVVGRESLDVMNDMVFNLFSGIPNTNVIVPRSTVNPFGRKQLQKMALIVPITDCNSLLIHIPCPDIENAYLGEYISELINQDGEHSFKDELLRMELALDLEASYKKDNGRSEFLINIDITTEGLDNYSQILRLFFQYINMIRSMKSHQTLFEEFKQAKIIDLTYSINDYMTREFEELCELLMNNSIDRVLCSNLTEDYPINDQVKNILFYFRAENMRIKLVSKKFRNQTNTVEKWFGIDYLIKPIPDNILRELKNVDYRERFSVSSLKIVMPKNLDIVNYDTSFKIPSIIQETKNSKLWLQQGGNSPMVEVLFVFKSSIVPENQKYFDTFIKWVNWKFNGLNCLFSRAKYGIRLYMYCYHDQLNTFLDYIMDLFVNLVCHIDEDIFEKEDEILEEHFEDFTHWHLYKALSNQNDFGNEQQEIKVFALEDMQKLILTFLAEMDLEACFHGNLSIQTSRHIFHNVQDKLSSAELWQPTIVKVMAPNSCKQINREPCLPVNSTVKKALSFLSSITDTVYTIGQSVLTKTIRKSTITVDTIKYTVDYDFCKCNAVLSYFECDGGNENARVCADLLALIMKSRILQTFRTDNELGGYHFTVTSEIYNEGVPSIKVYKESYYPTEFIHSRITLFINALNRILLDMNDESFELYKAGLTSKMKEYHRRDGVFTFYFFNQILAKKDAVNQFIPYLNILENITREELYKFYQDFLSSTSPMLKNVNIQMDGRGAFSVPYQTIRS